MSKNELGRIERDLYKTQRAVGDVRAGREGRRSEAGQAATSQEGYAVAHAVAVAFLIAATDDGTAGP